MKTISNITYPTLALFALASFAFSPAAQATCMEGCLEGNTFLGDDALSNNTGANNTAIGGAALFSNTNGFDNTAVGYQALLSNTTGYLNAATGSYALTKNTSGVQNTATGDGALANNTVGSYNTASGNGAVDYNTTGNYNTALGYNALLYNTTGDNNIALGATAGSNLTTGSQNIDIGNQGFRADANTIRIGKQGNQTAAFIAGISGVTVPAGIGVIVDSHGHLGTITSSARFKQVIKPMDKSSEVILALKPVTFRYTRELDPDGIPQFGLVAEQVEKVNPDLVARDATGKPYTVRYEAVNAMLLNEFLKEHRKVEEQEHELAMQASKSKEQEAAITGLRFVVKELRSSLKEQAAQIQKVSDQLEASKNAPAMLVDYR
jgi:hypothetical protein